MSYKSLFFLIIVLILPDVYSSWEQFQSDDFNSGKAEGTGYFNARAIRSSNDSMNGMNYQPLVSDIDNNGKNEIVIFFGNYLKIFDNQLNLINEEFVGKIQGQPTILDIDEDSFREIIFISNITSTPYFFAYEYNSDSFNQEFNFTVLNGGIGSGIKCTALGNTKVCVFMDNAQYVHIVNLTSKLDNSYNTSVYTDTQEKIPAIGDLHNNGSLEAVFWFDENNNHDYGLMAFDLGSKNLDSGFNNSGIVDDIFDSDTDQFVLKGHPVLVDLNNDGKLEIAVSAFYDDPCNYEWCAFNWFTEIFVYNSSGSRLFRKCEERSQSQSGNCNDGYSRSKREGTNPFVLDSDNNGIEDICFIKDKKEGGYFKNMTINCYNYSGSKILDSEITPLTDTVKIATVADMNNDGVLDIVTRNNIYHQNGSSFFNYDFSNNFAIPVDIDGNQGLDLLLSKTSQTKIFIDDFGTVELSNVSIAPLIPSSDDSLSCSWVVEGNGDLKANVSWYKDNILQLTENNIECLNGTKCTVTNPILNNLTNKNEEWKCSVAAFNESFKSYTRNAEVKILGKTSEWTDYCNAKNNLCRQSGTSYFSNADTKSIINNTDGMEYEPLVADINNDGKNEIIIFSNSKLIIFNQSLGLINEKNIGTLVGQPAIYNIDNDDNLEIIFNANISSTSYFMAYEYNNNFSKQCNISISNGLSGAGIKCSDIGATKSCFFKDQKNVFYNFNMSNCRQIANLTTNNNEDTTPTIPAILDYDNDNKLEGLWWFDNNGNGWKGIAVIELDTMNFDAMFNGNGFIDDIAIAEESGFYNVNLKSNPVFYQQDKEGGYEILIAYDNVHWYHIPSNHKCYKAYVRSYDTDGTLLWKRSHAIGCGGSTLYSNDISTPVILDANEDGYNEVCYFYIPPYDENNSIYCLDKFGNNAAGFPIDTLDTIKYANPIDTPLYIADMDNDNELEIVGSGYIWNLDGTILKGNYSSFTKFAPIPVDVDNNGVLELVGSKVNQTLIFSPNIDICNGIIQVQSVDYNNNFVADTDVFVNGILKGTTDNFGLFESQQSSICGEGLSYTLKCGNNSMVCETKTTSLDFNNDFDSLQFDCTICTGISDLKIDSGDINISTDNNQATVNITTENIIANDVNLTVKAQDKETGLISNENSVLFDINENDKFSVQTVSVDLNNADFIHIYIDPNNKVNEPKTNNYVVVPVITNKRKAFISVDTGNLYVDNAIKDYLSLFVIPTSDDDSSLTIAVGLGEHNPIINSKKSYTKNNFGWYVDSNSVYFNYKPIGSKPWVGLVGGFRENTGSDDYVFAMGKEIEGVVAAVKRLVNSRDKFFVPQLFDSHTSIIEDTDVLGISVFDLMHNEENSNKFNNQRTSEFQKVVENILEDNNFEVAIKTVKTVNDNTTLRLKNVNTDFSDDFKDAVVGNTKPVVLSRGIHSNLLTWNDFAKDIATDKDSARDTWLIEMVGGPTIDEDCGKYDCPDYTFSDLKTYYWPALIASVEQYSGQNTIDYVGYSLGCSAALESLELYGNTGKNNAGYYFDSDSGTYKLTDLAANPVDTFVAVACPGNFTDVTGVMSLLHWVDEQQNTFNHLIERGKTHITKNDIKYQLYRDNYLLLAGIAVKYPFRILLVELLSDFGFRGDSKMSTNIYSEIMKWIGNASQPNLGNNINLNRVAILQGRTQNFFDKLVHGENTDIIVPNADGRLACSNINSNDKIYGIFPGIKHFDFFSDSLPDDDRVKLIITKILNTQKINNESYFLYNTNCGVIE